MMDLEKTAKGSIIPLRVSETGADGEPLSEVIVCDSISGGGEQRGDMPRRLSLRRLKADGTEIRASYEQSDRAIEALGWAYADCCAALDRGEDPRKTEMPDVLERARNDLGLTG